MVNFLVLLDNCWNLGSFSDTDEKSRIVKLECVKLRKWIEKVRMQCNGDDDDDYGKYSFGR